MPYNCTSRWPIPLILLSHAVCAVHQTRFDGVTWDDSQWTIHSKSLEQGHYQSRGNLANGYIGINVASLGPFFDVDLPVHGDNIAGWPLFNRRQSFATVAGFYDVQATTNGTNFAWLEQYGADSVVSGLPHWAGLVVEYEGKLLDASTNASHISGYHSMLNLKTATLTWEFIWAPDSAQSFQIEYELFLHKLYVNQAAVRLRVTPSKPANITVYDVLDGDCAVRTDFVAKGNDTQAGQIWSAVSPWGIEDVVAYVYSTTLVNGSANNSPRALVPQGAYEGTNASSIAQALTLTLAAGSITTVQKYVGIASTDAFHDPQSVAKNASTVAAKIGYAGMHDSHVVEWNSIMLPDSIDSFHFPENQSLPNDPNTVEQQIQAVVNNFYLLQNTVGQGAISAAASNEKLDDYSIPVCGLSSDCYGGQIFWDAEVWMTPGLVVAFPQAAKQVAEYRVQKYAQAKANALDKSSSSRSNTTFSSKSAIFPWTSARYGNCTASGPCQDYEYHINGDIGLELENYYYVTGDRHYFRKQLFPIYNSVAQVYSDLLQFNTSSNLYELLNATDPDEYANFVSNPSYTMVLIRSILQGANRFRKQFGLPAHALWTRQAAALSLPTNDQAEIYLEYSGMNGSIMVKQADVILIDDFLDADNNYTVNDLDYYASRQSANGPGMTFGVFSIVAARAAQSGCSDYTYDLYGSQPYARGPFFQMSEQLNDDYTENGGTHPAFPFLTGHGGANRVTVFGFLGLQLRGDSFNINPTLPPQIPHLRYRTIYWQGHAISAFANGTHTTLTRLPLSRSLSTANPAYNNCSIPVTIANNATVYDLPFNGTLLFLNRDPAAHLTLTGNVAQCRPATSSQPYTPGQLPLAAVDGAASTVWQPTSPNVSATLAVSLGTLGLAPIAGLSLDWAGAPPSSFSVVFSNNSNPEPGQQRNATGVLSVSISEPYDAVTAAQVQQYVGNTTNVTLEQPIWGGLYALLTINGTLGDVEYGATVAEFAVFGV